MAKRERLWLPGQVPIETGIDWNGRYFIGYSKGSSMFFRNAKELRKWLGLPLKTPSRDSFDAWINSLEAADQQRAKPKDEGLTEEYLATGFGPETHLDESDPNYQTKMVL